MKRKIRALAEKFPARLDRALKLRAEGVMTRAKSEFVPVDLGALRSSGHVGDPERSGDGRDVEIMLSFGGPAAPYALVQHENLDYVHRVGEAKYLEKPLMEAVGTLAGDLADDLDVDRL